MVKPILLLGNPQLYETSQEVIEEELDEIKSAVADLHDTLIDFKQKYGVGRAIAAPQISIKKRLIYVFINEPVVFINPILELNSDEQMELLDDCMSFPNLLVKVRRYKHCRIKYKNMLWQDCTVELGGDLSELLQHEYDHLDGVLATMRAVDDKSYFLKY